MKTRTLLVALMMLPGLGGFDGKDSGFDGRGAMGGMSLKFAN